MQSRAISYFPGLNNIRGICVLLVLYGHINMYFDRFGLTNFYFPDIMSGSLAVTCFFVLSGYLITYLLFSEKHKHGEIDIKKFYVRRVLRIWPVYFLAFILSTIFLVAFSGVLPSYSWIEILLFLLFLNNFAYVFEYAIGGLTHLWSIGVEEQFYLFWPWVIKSKHGFLKLTLFIFIGFQILKLVFRFFEDGPIYHFFYYSRFDCMLIGAFGAWLVFTENKWLKYLKMSSVQWLVFLFLGYCLIFGEIYLFYFVDQQLYALLFIILIINVSTNEKTLLKMENGLLNFIGKLSYGIYVYHMLVLNMLVHFTPKYLINPWFTMISVILATILFAFISYELMEKPILKMKTRYTVLQND